MFENFQNLPTEYTPNNFQNCPSNTPIDPKNPNKPYELKNFAGDIIGYFWYYGNSIDLTFEIYDADVFTANSTYVNVEDYLRYCTLTVTLFNEYNWSIVHQQQLIPEKNLATLHIDAELSSKIVKGTYRIQLVATHQSGYNETIFSTNDCKLEVR